MKNISLAIILSTLFFSCLENTKNADSHPVTDTIRSADTNLPAAIDSNIGPNAPPRPVNQLKAGTHPISLHWISWEKKGSATVKPGKDGWYEISGSQTNEDREYLNIEGRIRRLSPKELEFDGLIETRIKMNNGGEPCIKKGLQRFFGKGSRTYYRLQNMENCEKGNLVDYIDIYPGTSSL